jgi:hypothetical protein
MSYVVSVLAVVSIRVRDGITLNLAKRFRLTALRGNKFFGGFDVSGCEDAFESRGSLNGV